MLRKIALGVLALPAASYLILRWVDIAVLSFINSHALAFYVTGIGLLLMSFVGNAYLILLVIGAFIVAYQLFQSLVGG